VAGGRFGPPCIAVYEIIVIVPRTGSGGEGNFLPGWFMQNLTLLLAECCSYFLVTLLLDQLGFGKSDSIIVSTSGFSPYVYTVNFCKSEKRKRCRRE